MTAVLKVEGLSFSYGAVPVLSDVSFEIQAGEFVGIIGPNGGGKTTLFKLILGFLKPTEGKIEVLGLPPQKARQQIAYVPQRLPFDRQFPISVFEVVLTGRLSHLSWMGRYSAHDRALALAALERVNLLEYQSAPFGSLSGGQAQRTLIARALVSEPKLLLLDEPTASVDVNAQNDIYEILKGLQGQITLLMVTHDLNAVIEHVQRILCVQREAFPLRPEEVCKHFAFGLYHTPLIQLQERP